MKTRLYKTGNEYLLKDLNGEVLAITNGSTEGRKLSKQNCDEIFGAVDINKLAEEYVIDESYLPVYKEECKRAYINGYKAAIELNKDKVFTLEDIIKAWDAGVMSRSIISMFNGELYKNKLKQHRDAYIQSLQQTTEIEVEIEMETASLNPHDLICEEIVERPKLDSEGCIILTKLINP